MPQLTTGKGKEAMQPPITKSKRTLEALSTSFALPAVQIQDHKRHAGARHTGSSHKTPGDESDAADAATIRDRFSLRRTIDSMDYDRGVLAAHPSRQPGHSVAVTTTACHFCRRTDFWPYLTCGVLLCFINTDAGGIYGTEG